MSSHSQQDAISAIQAFFNTPLDVALRRHLEQSPNEAAIALFRKVVAEVPAYQQFLTKHGITPKHIKNLSGFQQLPMTTCRPIH